MEKKGFTTMEILIVVILMGVLAAAVLSRTWGVEKYIMAEATKTLRTLREAQIRYYYEHNAYANDCALLDVKITPTYFDPPVCTAAGNSWDDVAAVLRPDNNEMQSYTVAVTAEGRYHCWITCNCGPCPDYVLKALPP